MKNPMMFTATAVLCATLTLRAQDSTGALTLLPETLGPMEKLMWSEKGAMRKLFDFPLTQEGRENEMHLRRNMLGLHQLGGFVTLASMITTVVLGQTVYNGKKDLSQIHGAMAWTTIGAYFTTASLSIFTPPPLIRRKNWSSISTHKLLATMHLTGMIITPLLGRAVRGGERDLATVHLVSAYATTALFGAAIFTVTF